MLPVSWSTIRLFVHVLAATVWVGGQLTLAGLVPGLRRLSPDAPRAVARRFNLIAWPAFLVLVVTGLWNIAVVKPVWDSAYGTTLMVKITVVVTSGASALGHARARSRTGLAVFGAVGALAALRWLRSSWACCWAPDRRDRDQSPTSYRPSTLPRVVVVAQRWTS